MKRLISKIQKANWADRVLLLKELESVVDNHVKKYKLVEKDPTLGDRTAVNTLLEFYNRGDTRYPRLHQIEKEIKELYKFLINEFKVVDTGYKIKDHIDNIKNIFGLKKRPSFDDLIGDVYFEETDISENTVMSIGKAVEKFISIFPDKYLQNAQDITVVLEKENAFSYARPDSDQVHIFFQDDNVFDKIAQLIHEIVHIIEHHNPTLQKAVLNMVYNRSESKMAINAKDLAQQYNKVCPEGINDLKVYQGKWDDLYRGYIYESSEYISTELLSMSFQELFTDPISMMIRDPKLFEFIFDIVKGKRLSKYKLEIPGLEAS